METIKISNHALKLIPEKMIIIFHSMWEDSDIYNHELAEVDCRKIGTGTILFTGDYIISGCGHGYECDVYDPWYQIAWVSSQNWEAIKGEVLAADKEWRDQSSVCKKVAVNE